MEVKEQNNEINSDMVAIIPQRRKGSGTIKTTSSKMSKAIKKAL